MDHYETPKLGIKQWAEADRPREKLMLKGKSTLSDAELIAILLGSGTVTLSAVELAKQILHEANNDLSTLARFSVADLKKFKGIGEAKAITIVSAMELGRRRKNTEQVSRPKVRSAKECYDYMSSDLLDLEIEEFWLILLKKNNEVISKERISMGGVSGTFVDPKIIFNKAISALASNIILVHNHPSGNLRPSEHDIRLTKRLKSAGELLDIPVVDHIIFTNDSFFSFADESLL